VGRAADRRHADLRDVRHEGSTLVVEIAPSTGRARVEDSNGLRAWTQPLFRR
jgi:hypothetical protein